MTAQLSPLPVFKAWDNAGIPLNGGKLFTYVAGSTTKQASYTDSTAGTPNANPVILNYRGEANVWLDPTKVYKLVLAPANDTDPPTNPFWTVDQISGGILSPTGSIIPTVDNLFTLGSTSFSWANVYIGANHAPVLDSVSGNIGYYARTSAEVSAGANPVAFSYPPGHVYRYGTNTTPGTTDMTSAINTAASVARTGNVVLQIPQESKLLVSSSLNLSGCRVLGLGDPFAFNGGIQASAAQFDVITSTGFTIIDDLWVDGGWDNVTTGLTGDILSLTAAGAAHPYVNSFSNCNFQNAKRNGVFINRGGYTSFYHMHVLNCGLHGMQCTGIANTDPCTSIRDYGGSQYGNTPNGYGLDLTNCIAMNFHGTIIETTNGIRLSGVGNRALIFDGIYQEFNPTPSFTAKIDNGAGGAGTILTVTAPAALAGLGVGSVITGAGVTANTVITGSGTGVGGIGTYTVNNSQNIASEAMTASKLMYTDNSGGAGLSIRGNIGIGLSMPFAPGVASFANWINVYFSGNDGVAEGPIPLANRIQTNGLNNQSVTTTSNVTGPQLTLVPGTYRLTATAQTVLAAGGPAISQFACSITTNVADAPPDNSVGSLVEGADQTQSFGTVQDGRLKAYTVVQVFTSTTYFLRLHFTLGGAGTIGWAAQLRAELIE